MGTHKVRMRAEQPPLPASRGALISGGMGHPPVPGTGHPVFAQASHGHHSAAPGVPVVFPVAHQAHLARRLRGAPPRPLIGRPAPLLCPPVIWNRPSTTWPAWWVNFSRHPFPSLPRHSSSPFLDTRCFLVFPFRLRHRLERYISTEQLHFTHSPLSPRVVASLCHRRTATEPTQTNKMGESRLVPAASREPMRRSALTREQAGACAMAQQPPPAQHHQG